MPMELQGFDNLRDDLTNMASNLEFGQGVNRALREGAKPIEEDHEGRGHGIHCFRQVRHVGGQGRRRLEGISDGSG